LFIYLEAVVGKTTLSEGRTEVTKLYRGSEARPSGRAGPTSTHEKDIDEPLVDGWPNRKEPLLMRGLLTPEVPDLVRKANPLC